MSYDKYTWQTGETITAEKLNHIEDGIAEGGGSAAIDKLLELRQDDSGFNVYDGDTKLTFFDLYSLVNNGAVVLHFNNSYSLAGIIYFTGSTTTALAWGFMRGNPQAYSINYFIFNQNNTTDFVSKTISRGEPLCVTVTGTGSSASSDREFTEIRDALKEGRIVYVYVSSCGRIAHLVSTDNTLNFDEVNYITFESVYGEDGSVHYIQVRFSDNSIYVGE